MALTTGNWYQLAFGALASPPWTTPNPDVGGGIINAIVTASSIIAYCVDDSVPGGRYEIAWHGGRSIIPAGAETMIASLAKFDLTDDDGETTSYTHDGSSLLWYGPGGAVKRLNNPAAFKAWI
jgi:hypothetical protein